MVENTSSWIFDNLEMSSLQGRADWTCGVKGLNMKLILPRDLASPRCK